MSQYRLTERYSNAVAEMAKVLDVSETRLIEMAIRVLQTDMRKAEYGYRKIYVDAEGRQETDNRGLIPLLQGGL